MKRKGFRRALSPTLALAALLSLLSACGNSGDTPTTAGPGGTAPSAATMYLRRTEGQVQVSDDKAQSVEPMENLGLFSGYGVGTEAESYAWVDLDSVKLTKMDQESEIAITKEGKKLEIEVKSGSLFFNVTEPLAEDETLEIRTSNMIVGIRGTCGWVEVPDPEHLELHVLEGVVEYWVDGWESGGLALPTGHVTIRSDGELEMVPFDTEEIPDFVMEEISSDEELVLRIKNNGGYDLSGQVGGGTPETGGGEAEVPEVSPYPSSITLTYEYDSQGRITRVNEVDETGTLKYYHTFDYIEDSWVDVYDYYPDGSLDGWILYDNIADFYEGYKSILPEDYTP